MTMANGTEVDWEHPYAIPRDAASQTIYRSGHSNGYREGYADALRDLAERKAIQREVIDQALVQRFAEILADLRQRAA